jgi:hypothetical protein
MFCETNKGNVKPHPRKHMGEHGEEDGQVDFHG